ncbi:unnamed protein product [Lampetra planeri]
MSQNCFRDIPSSELCYCAHSAMFHFPGFEPRLPAMLARSADPWAHVAAEVRDDSVSRSVRGVNRLRHHSAGPRGG